ncbi:enolase [Pholiota molesta]|nr:enolase [Pholiota molesta]
MHITRLEARQIFDSRGIPTVEVDLYTQNGLFRASAPAGASTGVHEAVELRDGDNNAYMGKGVLKAVANVNNIIAPKLIKSGLDVTKQLEIDNFLITLDGTPGKCKLGANAVVAVSMAVTMAGASASGPPYILPTPAFNVINGGRHAGNSLAAQEFMIMPVGATSFAEAMKMGTETYQHLMKVVKNIYGLMVPANVGDEGGFAPDLQTAEEALGLLVLAIKNAGYTEKVKIAVDFAASEFFDDGKYNLDFKSPNPNPKNMLDTTQMIQRYLSFLKKYPVVSLEDPFAEDDWDAWSDLTRCARTQVVADDLTVTSPRRIDMAVKKKAANALLLKANQIGTVSETIVAAKVARADGWALMVSHRSGGTETTFIADLAVGLGAGQIKAGAPARMECVSKYNALIRIE